MSNKQFEEIVLYEIRENRKEIQQLKMQVFSNKVKLGMFIAGLTLFFNIVFIFLAEKAKSLIS